MGNAARRPAGGPFNRLVAVTAPPSPPALRLDGVSKSFRRDTGESVLALDNISFSVDRGGLAALVGPDGAGKTTLIRALTGELPLAGGSRRIGPAVVFGELTQARDLFTGVLLDDFCELSRLTPAAARTLLAKFALGPDDIVRAAASLSPGERTRAGLALLATRGVNCLILDEPTNHLDLEAIEELETALAGYEGCLVVVTHDRRFLTGLAVTRTMEL
jgi:ATPase subunit of ABC transporter with duplicated ATPase domains